MSYFFALEPQDFRGLLHPVACTFGLPAAPLCTQAILGPPPPLPLCLQADMCPATIHCKHPARAGRSRPSENLPSPGCSGLSRVSFGFRLVPQHPPLQGQGVRSQGCWAVSQPAASSPLSCCCRENQEKWNRTAKRHAVAAALGMLGTRGSFGRRG